MNYFDCFCLDIVYYSIHINHCKFIIVTIINLLSCPMLLTRQKPGPYETTGPNAKVRAIKIWLGLKVARGQSPALRTTSLQWWLLARCVIMYLEIGSETRTITRPTVIKYNKTQNNVAIKSGNAVVMTYRVTFHCCKSSWLADRADYEPLVHHWKIRVHCCRYLQRNCARLRFSYFLRCGKL